MIVGYRLVAFAIVAIFIVGSATAQKTKKVQKRVAPASSAAQTNKGVTDPWKLLNTRERMVEISTDYGVMIAKLYDSTPIHRDNFVRLVEKKFYDSLLFHRVIPQFMIQGGDPFSKSASEDTHLGTGSLPGDRLPAEFRPYLFHKKGALAAARDDNPSKASSNCQYYIVAGKTSSEEELEQLTKRVKGTNPNYSYTAMQKEVYRRIGGTPFLDQGYTVFGEVISGLDVVDKIANAPRDDSDRPKQNIRMKIRMLN